MKTIVIGLGNPLLGDDGVGWRVAESLRQSLSQFITNLQDQIEIICLSRGGLALMEHLIGYDRAILIDAVNLRKGQIGDVVTMPLYDLPNYASGHTSSAHDTTLLTAMKLGKKMGVSLPSEVLIVGIETSEIYDFSEELSPPVEASIADATDVVFDLIVKDSLKNQLPNNKKIDHLPES